MSTLTERPQIQCRFTNGAGNQCPLPAMPGAEYCKVHTPKE